MFRAPCIVLLCLAGRAAPALGQIELQGFLGSSLSAPSPLSVTQAGQPRLDFTARWATRPWLDTWYYAGRVGFWKGDRGNRVRGQQLESGRGFLGGYFLSGATVVGGVTRRFPIASGLFVSLDGRISATYVRVPVAGGHASVPNFAVHLHGGLGYQADRPAARQEDAR